jgi:hypothetical protein
MNEIQFLCGNENITSNPRKPFADEICQFLDEVSILLVKSPENRAYPDVLAFAFWCRKSNLNRLKENYDDLSWRLGRGLCFHIAPSNVPVTFAFSYVFSLLAGNTNIVRVPSKAFPQVDVICRAVETVLSNYSEIKKGTTFIKYQKSSDLTAHFCKISDCRMVWGGDETVNQIRHLEVKPTCVDIFFPNKYSLCLINAEEIIKASQREMEQLIHNFYKDTYLMDQNACSSPHLVCWVNDSEFARNKFWNHLTSYAEKKYLLTDAMASNKYLKLCNDLIDINTIQKTNQHSNFLYRIELSELTINTDKLKGQSGYFYEYPIDSLEKLTHVINEKYQTLTYFGFDPSALVHELLNLNVKGIDRIVPVGSALNIDITWDGHDILRELSRKIVSL